tara:strand:- start:155 stop:304 length:150 start_codon:yes stop_codon:yes gene_type:complete
MANQTKGNIKKTEIKKLKISKKAIIKQKSTMGGCGRAFDTDCGISRRAG